MIKGIGIDLVNNERIELIYRKYKDSFALKILSQEELKKFYTSKSKTTFLSKRFASKEAFSKALGTGLYRDGLYPTHLTIQHDKFGKPTFLINKIASKFLDKISATSAYLSITDTEEHTAAVVVIE
ncbi:MAG: holo-ACP synthase [Pseudomonadota bacterium]|nr:holo-ACP synthase [Pseudomonadota bacterium]MED5274811.1 holo-ACP synthase [Pseudomonadota bacterium]MED5430051.1 holo-ACP synthase [Pseudomonadota bacterium]